MDKQEMEFWGITENDLTSIQQRLDDDYNDMMKYWKSDIEEDNPSYMN